MSAMEYVALFFVAIACAEGAKLPSYIAPCRLSDPRLNECAAKHGQEALSSIVKGDPKYKIPSMLPLKISEIKFSSGDLHIKLNNVEISGLEDTQIADFKMDTQKRHFSIIVAIPRANLISTYDINGKILILPMKGQGPANITFGGDIRTTLSMETIVNPWEEYRIDTVVMDISYLDVDGEYNYQFDYNLKEKNGEEYMEMSNTKLDYTTKRSHYHFENLFGGDKVLGNQLNQFLDENWKEVEHDIGPALSQTIDTIITTTITGIFDKVPYNELFLP